MGNYNPRAPQILGQEWVPIRDENLQFDPFAHSFERGHSFALPSAQQLSSVRFYVHEFPPNFVRNHAWTASVYRQGEENQSGPVRSVIIPCNNGGVTGSTLSISPAGLTVPQVVYNPSGNYFLSWTIGFSASTQNRANFFFATNSYAQLLNGKRILGVDFLTQLTVNDAGNDLGDLTASSGDLELALANDATAGIGGASVGPVVYPSLVTAASPSIANRFVRVHLGDVNVLYGQTGALATGTPNISQWTYSELQRFEASNANRIFMYMRASNSAYEGASVFLSYAALEIFYCEENRVAFGTRNIMGQRFDQSRDPYILGANTIVVRGPSGNANPILTSGNYTVAVSLSNTGDDIAALTDNAGNYAQLNESRQLYEIPSHPGVQVNIPYPLNDETIGTTLTAEYTDLLPQLSLHASGGNAWLEPHVYGRQAAGQVYGTNYVTQEIKDSVIGAATSWPWVTYYARRFGDTTAALRLSCITPSISGAGVMVDITPGEFDLLDEITDGWKAVTLRFPTPPVMGNGAIPVWKWSAVNETVGNRWEVLGAIAPAASGIAQQMAINLQFGQVPTAQQLWNSTYGQPVSGGVINMDWLPQWGPYVSGSTPDQAADVAIIFGQDMPTVTGFSVVGMSQPVTGIGQACGFDPCGIPSAIGYNRLTWTPNAATLDDNFDRVTAQGWGTNSTYGVSWSLDAEFSTDGTRGLLTQALGTLDLTQATGFTSLNQEVEMSFTAPAWTVAPGPTSVIFQVVMYLRRSDSSNNYAIAFDFDGSGIGQVSIDKIQGGFLTTLQTYTNVPSMDFIPSQSQDWKLKAQVYGGVVRAKVWRAESDEPEIWSIVGFDTGTTLPAAQVAVRFFTSNTYLTAPNPATFYVANFKINTAADIAPITYELQRYDTVDEAWSTIMRSSDPYLYGFNDYEARVGIETSYRIRRLSSYDFEGPWSSTVAITMASPGLTGDCLDDAHVLIFTTNERQNGSSNLAYSSVWDGRVVEDFTFPEATFVQLQPMYDRSFFTAFKPLERGGDQWQRNVLVQAAAIPPETLADFKSLRDMAWDNVSYICVRDEDGNRWFASVAVPSGTVQNRRRLYIAQIQVTEVTDTPSPVDPS